MENPQLIAQSLGMLIGTMGLVWLVVEAGKSRIWWLLPFPPALLFFPIFRWKNAYKPLAIMFLGALIAASPLIYNRAMPLDLGPYQKVVGNEVHLTLTGWDREDYSFLKSKSDVVVLQMANADVNDQVLESLGSMTALRELDISNSQVTDSGCQALSHLKGLKTLRLANVKISDEGFRKLTDALESLTQLDLRGTNVSKDAVKAWRDAKSGRRAMQ